MSKKRREKLYQNPLRYEPGYSSLAEGIVWRAAIDYEIILQEGPIKHKGGTITKEEVESFFRSSWCEQLTGLDGEWLMGEIQDRCKTSISQWQTKEKEEEIGSEWEKNKVRYIYRRMQDDGNPGEKSGKFLCGP